MRLTWPTPSCATPKLSASLEQALQRPAPNFASFKQFDDSAFSAHLFFDEPLSAD
jgi:hypothetical protein